ncbi:N-6 DNA methylase [Streptomyces thinghirensis]|nr:N-6 DNA methylase [Streptomyces thinghirensis]
MLTKLAAAGQNGQFRTPRHIIDLMVEMTQPKPDDEVCDPACGTAGFLVQTASYVKREHSEGTPWARSSKPTSTEVCSTASTSTPRCCASGR